MEDIEYNGEGPEELSRLSRLVLLRDQLQTAVSNCESYRDMAALAKQYRETLKEIEDLEKENETTEDDIAELLTKRKADGKAGAVR